MESLQYRGGQIDLICSGYSGSRNLPKLEVMEEIRPSSFQTLKPRKVAHRANQERGDGIVQSDHNDEYNNLHSCTVMLCIKAYVSFKRLQAHLDIGSHTFPTSKLNLIDVASLSTRYAFRVSEGGHEVPAARATSQAMLAEISNNSSLCLGWALKTTNKAKGTFTEKTKMVLYSEVQYWLHK